MPVVQVLELTKKFGPVTAVDSISFDVKHGTLTSLLGPSGCGKTTTLRCIAGLEKPEGGEIMVGERVISSSKKNVMVPPEHRGMGLVFQSYALWPHMTVFDNIAYPLKVRHVRKPEIRERVTKSLELVGLGHLGSRYPSQISGGEQQRTALARSLVYEPDVLLLDEPLSNLDAKLRERTRLELKDLHKRLGITAIYVTHDQVEAMTISDTVAVMSKGRIMQIGTPEDVYKKPAHVFVSDFIGTANFLEGVVQHVDGHVDVELDSLKGLGAPQMSVNTAHKVKAGDRVILCVRPESIDISDSVREGRPGISVFEGQVKTRIYMGSNVEYRVDVGGTEIKVFTDPHRGYKEGSKVFLHINTEYIALVPLERK